MYAYMHVYVSEREGANELPKKTFIWHCMCLSFHSLVCSPRRTSSSRSTSMAKFSFSFFNSDKRFISLLIIPSSSASVRLNISTDRS